MYFSVLQCTPAAIDRLGGAKFVRVQRPTSAPLPSVVEWQLHVGEVQTRVLGVLLAHMIDLIKGLA